MVKLRPYVVAVNHVTGCPRLESGQGGRRQGHRRCAPGCERMTNGWEVDLALRLPDGTPIRERVKAPVSSKSAALRWAQDREAVILAQRGRQPKKTETKKAPTLTSFKPRFLEGHVKANRLKPSTASTYEMIFRVHLEPAFGALRIDAISDELVQRLKGDLVENERNSKTINNVLTALSVMLKRAADWKVIDAMPCRIKLLKYERTEVSFYDFADYEKLLQGAAALDVRIELLALLGGDAGLRRGEAIAVEWSDVDQKRSVLHVQRSEWDGHVTTPKGGRSRRVPMTARLAAALKAHRHLRGSRVLCQENGDSIGRQAVHEWMEKAQRRAGLPVTGAYHILRHTFCSHLAMQGATAKAIQELAGHQDLGTTQRYIHLSPAHKDAAIRLLDRRPTGESVGDGLETGSEPEAKSREVP